MKFKRKETDKEIHDRILKLCHQDYKEQIPYMNAQEALNGICDHLLGEDWYVVDPLSACQINPIIVEEIERKFRKKIKLKLKIIVDGLEIV